MAVGVPLLPSLKLGGVDEVKVHCAAHVARPVVHAGRVFQQKVVQAFGLQGVLMTVGTKVVVDFHPQTAAVAPLVAVECQVIESREAALRYVNRTTSNALIVCKCRVFYEDAFYGALVCYKVHASV